jgi:branched-chain amino acid transport system substrate-binding protein
MTQRIYLPGLTRRGLLTGAAGAATLAVAPGLRTPAIAQKAPLKVGLMLPYTGTFAKLGQFIDDGFRLYVEQKGGKLGGRQGRRKPGAAVP